jgi:hypothetical protein
MSWYIISEEQAGNVCLHSHINDREYKECRVVFDVQFHNDGDKGLAIQGKSPEIIVPLKEYRRIQLTGQSSFPGSQRAES